MDMAAIAANPDHFPAPFEHKAFLNILHKAQISLFMLTHTIQRENCARRDSPKPPDFQQTRE